MKKRMIALLLAAMMIWAMPAMAEATKLTVRGNGVVTLTADQANVVLGVREYSTDAQEVQSTVNAKINAIYDALIAAGVDKKDIGTDSLYMYANYDYSGNEEKIVGYTATNTLRLRTEQLDNLGGYIDIAFGAGANTLDNIQFSAKDSETAQKEALQLAVQNAYEKAEVVAEAAGQDIASVLVIEENDSYYGMDSGAKYSNARVTGEAAMDESTLIQASSLQISASVTVEFELTEGQD